MALKRLSKPREALFQTHELATWFERKPEPGDRFVNVYLRDGRAHYGVRWSSRQAAELLGGRCQYRIRVIPRMPKSYTLRVKT